MVDEDIFEAEVWEYLPFESTTMAPEQMELERLSKVELEKARLGQETSWLKLELMKTRQRDERFAFDITKQARLVPKFVEENSDEYFAHFERTAVRLSRPKNAEQFML